MVARIRVKQSNNVYDAKDTCINSMYDPPKFGNYIGFQPASSRFWKKSIVADLVWF